MKLQDSESMIAKFYSEYPFPNIPLHKKKDIYRTLIYKLIHGLTKKYLDKYDNKRLKILDVGCGTGELDLGLADGKREILGIDSNEKSIAIAKARVIKFKIPKVKFKKYNFVKSDLPKNYYDFIFSIGVLHHTENPEKNFKKLVRSLKVGGHIVIGIYNPYGSFKVMLKRGILNLLAGDNFERKIEIYRKLFYRRKLTLAEEIAVADAFANPYRRYYSFEQLLLWFKREKIEYLDSVPSIELTKNLKLAIKILSGLVRNNKSDLMSSWSEVTYKSGSVKKWELSKPLTKITQLFWVPIGRGELINLVGRKLK